MLDRFRLDGTTAIVTGGSRNMGRTFSLALADAGANVAIVDLPQQADAAASDVVREIEKPGRRAFFAPLDLRVSEDIPACVDQIVSEMGPVSTLINNAGKTDDVPTSVSRLQVRRSRRSLRNHGPGHVSHVAGRGSSHGGNGNARIDSQHRIESRRTGPAEQPRLRDRQGVSSPHDPSHGSWN